MRTSSEERQTLAEKSCRIVGLQEEKTRKTNQKMEEQCKESHELRGRKEEGVKAGTRGDNSYTPREGTDDNRSYVDLITMCSDFPNRAINLQGLHM